MLIHGAEVSIPYILQQLALTPSPLSTRYLRLDPLAPASVPSVARSWDDVMRYLNAGAPPLTIFVAADVVIPAGVYEMRNATLVGLFSQALVVTAEDGAVLRNLHGVTDNLTLRSISSAPMLEFDFSPSQPSAFVMSTGGKLRNDGTAPQINVPDGFGFVLVLGIAGQLTNPTPGVGTLLLGNGSTAIVVAADLPNALSTFGDVAQGPATATLAYIGFGGPYPTPAGFAGSVQNIAGSLVGGSGPTAQRPPSGLGGPVEMGTSYFDSTIAKPVWWDGAQWVDATGAPA
jgi:hypothetical protein